METWVEVTEIYTFIFVLEDTRVYFALFSTGGPWTTGGL